MAGPPPSTPPRGPRVLEESDYGGAAASGASGQTGPLIGQVGALRATGSRSSYSPPRHRVACIRMTVGYGKSRFTRARRKQTKSPLGVSLWTTVLLDKYLYGRR